MSAAVADGLLRLDREEQSRGEVLHILHTGPFTRSLKVKVAVGKCDEPPQEREDEPGEHESQHEVEQVPAPLDVDESCENVSHVALSSLLDVGSVDVAVAVLEDQPAGVEVHRRTQLGHFVKVARVVVAWVRLDVVLAFLLRLLLELLVVQEDRGRANGTDLVIARRGTLLQGLLESRHDGVSLGRSFQGSHRLTPAQALQLWLQLAPFFYTARSSHRGIVRFFLLVTLLRALHLVHQRHQLHFRAVSLLVSQHGYLLLFNYISTGCW